MVPARSVLQSSEGWDGINRARNVSHERFHEAHDLIIRAWSFQPALCQPLAAALPNPHPPVWIPSQGSSETVAWAADPKRKYPFLVTFSSADLVARYHKSYREKATIRRNPPRICERPERRILVIADAPAKVLDQNRQRTPSFGGGNWSSC
jgi:alkanesulfonate monooxygenase SsuD/methylene tetrahydromethanopterin reductase-like flavin-dependent oxidoreductase (luciferase family)